MQQKVQSYTWVMCTCVNPCVQLHTCTICLSTCYDYPCLRVVSADVACIPMYTCVYTRVLLNFSLHGTVFHCLCVQKYYHIVIQVPMYSHSYIYTPPPVRDHLWFRKLWFLSILKPYSYLKTSSLQLEVEFLLAATVYKMMITLTGLSG